MVLLVSWFWPIEKVTMHDLVKMYCQTYLITVCQKHSLIICILSFKSKQFKSRYRHEKYGFFKFALSEADLCMCHPVQSWAAVIQVTTNQCFFWAVHCQYSFCYAIDTIHILSSTQTAVRSSWWKHKDIHLQKYVGTVPHKQGENVQSNHLRSYGSQASFNSQWVLKHDDNEIYRPAAAVPNFVATSAIFMFSLVVNGHYRSYYITLLLN